MAAQAAPEEPAATAAAPVSLEVPVAPAAPPLASPVAPEEPVAPVARAAQATTDPHYPMPDTSTSQATTVKR